MSEIALRSTSNGAVAVAEPRTTAIATLNDWASELDAAGQIAAKLCQTPFVPQHFRGKPADAAAAILTGHELGLSPMASLRSIFLISGTPGMYAKAMVAVVQAAGHEIWVEEQSDDRVVVCGRRKGSDHVFRTMWDRARVVTAKLNTNPKYAQNSQQMMVARGQAEICRQVAADALHGVPYTVEELEDLPPVRAEATVAPRVTAAEILGQVDDPQNPQATVDTKAPVETEQVTPEQLAENFALMTAAGYTDRAEAMAFVSSVVGRTIGARTELSPAELAAVNARLSAIDEPAAEEPADDDAMFDGPRLLSGPQQRHIMALSTELGLTNRDARLEYVAGITGRPAASTNDLTSTEASQVIEAMLSAKARQDAEPAPEKTLAETAKAQGAMLRKATRAAATVDGV